MLQRIERGRAHLQFFAQRRCDLRKRAFVGSPVAGAADGQMAVGEHEVVIEAGVLPAVVPQMGNRLHLAEQAVGVHPHAPRSRRPGQPMELNGHRVVGSQGRGPLAVRHEAVGIGRG